MDGAGKPGLWRFDLAEAGGATPSRIRVIAGEAVSVTDSSVTFRLQGKATPHDVVVSSALAGVLSGGDTDITREVDEDELLELERTAFLKLVRTRATVARIEHMLTTGKPLRN